MKTTFLLISIPFFLLACGNEENKAETEAWEKNMDVLNQQVLTQTPSSISDELLAKFDVSVDPPIEPDSTYLRDLKNKTNTFLTREDVKYLSNEYLETQISASARYYIDYFFEMDSLKGEISADEESEKSCLAFVEKK